MKNLHNTNTNDAKQNSPTSEKVENAFIEEIKENGFVVGRRVMGRKNDKRKNKTS